MKATRCTLVFICVFTSIQLQVKGQFLGGEEDGNANIRLTNTSCVAINTNPFLGGEADGHSNARLSNTICPVINNNPFVGGEADGHSNERLSNVVCPVINNNPFAGGEADGHANLRQMNVICPVINNNPFLGGDADGHANEELINNPLCIPLPIELLTFMAVPKDKVVELNWTTSIEINNAYFTIERSKNGISFDSILYSKGAGNSATVLKYAAMDASPLYGISYYRLKQTDFDGHSEYSKIISVNFENESKGELWVYPLPFTTELTLELNQSQESAKYEIINALGATVLCGSFTQKITLPTFRLSAGVYFVKIDTGGFIETRKIIKQ